MACLRQEIVIDADPDAVWDAVRDWGALHERLAPGFVTDTQLDGPDRIVTFFNGAVAREVLVSRDDAERRQAWTIVDGPYRHHHGVAQVFAEPDGRTRFVWTTDLLPDALAEPTGAMMAQGIEAIRATLVTAAPDTAPPSPR
jgi:hypothetical protein